MAFRALTLSLVTLLLGLLLVNLEAFHLRPLIPRHAPRTLARATTSPQVDRARPTSSQFDDEAEAISNFERRISESKVKAEGLQHASFQSPLGTSYRGIKAKADTSSDKPIIILPKEQTIYLNEEDKCPFPEWVTAKTWAKMPWYARLGLKLLYERKEARDPVKTSYASLLPGPGSLQTPYHWTDPELSSLHYDALKNNVMKQRKAWKDLWQSLSRKNRAGREVTEEDLVWAMESVLSRAFKGSFGSGLASLIPSLILAAVCFLVQQYDEQNAQLLAYNFREFPYLQAVIPVIVFAPLVREFRKPQATYLLAPMVDSLNHRTEVPTDLEFDSFGQQLKLVINKAYKAGEQVFMSYGRKSNDELLQFYGFVEVDNPADSFVFADLLSWLTQHDPNISERLQALASKGLTDAVKKCKLLRGGKVADDKALEGLRLLLSTNEELTSDEEITEKIILTPMSLTASNFEESPFKQTMFSSTEERVWHTLQDACKWQLQHLQLTDQEQETLEKAPQNKSEDGHQYRSLLALAFRKEKSRVLNEAIGVFEARKKEALTLMDKNNGDSSSSSSQ